MASLNQVPSSTSLGSGSYPHRLRHGVPDNVIYVHPDGDDNNDGDTWGTAKETLCAGYDALPSAGGTVYVAHGSDIGGSGLLICGPSDPNYASPLAGWRQQKTAVCIVGVGGQTTSVYGPQAQISLTGNPITPWIWLAGTSAAHYFKDLRIVYPSIAFRMGVASDLSNRISQSSSIVLDNVCADSSRVAAGGPTVDLGYTFWLWFIRGSGFSGNYNAATQVGEYIPAIDRSSSIYAKGDDNVSGGFVMEDAVIGEGWFRLYMATSGSGSRWRIKEVLFEGAFGDFPVDAPIEFFDANAIIGYTHLEQIDQADASGIAAVVRINKTSGTDEQIAKKFLCVDVSSVIGPATLVNSQTATPENRYNQRGVVDERFSEHLDHGRRLFAPTAARLANLAFHSSASWTASNPDATVTTGKTAPDGTTGAVEVTGSGFKQVVNSDQTFAVGDHVVGGVWVRSTTGAASFDGRLPYFCDINTASFAFEDAISQAGAAYRASGDGDVGTDWQWVSFIRKVSAVGSNPGALRAFVGGSNAAPLQYYAPVMFRLPTADYSVEEAHAFRMHLGSWPDTVPAGAVSTMRGQKLIAWGGLGVGNSAAGSTPGTVVKKIQVFDETGTSLGYVAVYDAIT